MFYLAKITMIVKGVESAFRMRNIAVSAFNESKALAIIIYNIGLCVSFVVIVMVLISDVATKWILSIFALLWILNGTIIILFGSKVYHVMQFGYSGGEVVSTGSSSVMGTKKGASEGESIGRPAASFIEESPGGVVAKPLFNSDVETQNNKLDLEILDLKSHIKL
jgi:hypothetical protein